MILKLYNKTTCNGSNDLPKISINRSGTIFFNKALIGIMHLGVDDKVEFACDISDVDYPNWYIFKSNDSNAFRIRGYAYKSKFLVQSKTLAVDILSSLNLNEGTFKMLVNHTPVVYDKKNMYLIISVSAKPARIMGFK